MSRIKAIVEIGPHQGSPYANWGVYEIGPDAFEDHLAFEADFSEIADVLGEVDTRCSPYGEFSEQIRDYINASALHLLNAEESGKTAEKRRDFVLPYDQAHREARDAGEYMPRDSIDPQDLSVSVTVFTVEEDC